MGPRSVRECEGLQADWWELPGTAGNCRGWRETAEDGGKLWVTVGNCWELRRKADNCSELWRMAATAGDCR